jgi:hypothetical protein
LELGGVGRPNTAGFSDVLAGVRTEDGMRESEKKMYSVKYTKGARELSGPMRGTMVCE